jgi:hypothetical protein
LLLLKLFLFFCPPFCILSIPPKRAQTNGPLGGLQQIIQEEFYKVAFREKLYSSLEEIQGDLDEFMAGYNRERIRTPPAKGRTPLQTFSEGFPLYQEYVHDEGGEKEVL